MLKRIAVPFIILIHMLPVCGVAFRYQQQIALLQQLKNGSNLRLIQKVDDSDSIIAYDVASRGYTWGNLDEEEIMVTGNIAETIFDGPSC